MFVIGELAVRIDYGVYCHVLRGTAQQGVLHTQAAHVLRVRSVATLLSNRSSSAIVVLIIIPTVTWMVTQFVYIRNT